jgi:hypothetical protein
MFTMMFVTFFACPKKVTKKKTPTKDDSPFVGGFPDLASALL